MAILDFKLSPCSEYTYYVFFWVFPRHLNYICRRFGTLYLFIPPAYEDGTDRAFQNVVIYNSDAGEILKRKHNVMATQKLNTQSCNPSESSVYAPFVVPLSRR